MLLVAVLSVSDRVLEGGDLDGELGGQAEAFDASVDALSGLGFVHSALGEVRQAREELRQSLTILEALGAPEAETVRRLLAALQD